MRFETKRLSELKPAEYNPQKKLQPGDPEFEKIARSIEEFGYVDPIIINKDGTIIGGHQRCAVMEHLGYTEAEVVVLDLDKNREKACNIALNKIAGEWDKEKLTALLIELDASELNTDVTGFDKNELSDLIAEVIIPETVSDDGFDEEKAVSEITESRVDVGEVWQLGRHRLMCGDSTSADDVGRLMDGERALLIVTDPPYNINYEEKVESLNRAGMKSGRKENHIENDHMDSEHFYKFLYSAFKNMNSAAMPGAAFYVFHADLETINFRKALADAGFKVSECLIWEKNSFVLGRQDYHWKHEPVLYGWKEGAGHYFINDRTQDTIFCEDDIDFEAMSKKELLAWVEQHNKSASDQTTVIKENKPHRSDMHPTMKPVELIGKFIRNSSRPGWTVLDLFGGSGSTLIAAEQLERPACLMEYSPVYCEMIIRRWEEFTGNKAVRLNERL